MPPEGLPDVSYIYGPGVMGGWLCVITGILVSWKFNPMERKEEPFTSWALYPLDQKKDKVTKDLKFAVAYPVIATYHTWCTLFLTPGLFSSDFVRSEVEESVASMAAALSVTHAFLLMLPVFIFAISERWAQRLVFISLVPFSYLTIPTPWIVYIAARSAGHFEAMLQCKPPISSITWVLYIPLVLVLIWPLARNRETDIAVAFLFVLVGVSLDVWLLAKNPEPFAPGRLLFFFPETRHSIFDIHQWLPLVLGVFTALRRITDTVKERRRVAGKEL